ncbi:MAG: hypothetical protein V7609_2130 [Verrucomicrobiota bacterium]
MNADVPTAIVITVDNQKRIELNRAGRRSGLGECGRCLDSWLWKPHHTTDFTSRDGVFPLCEDCWKRLTPDERLPFYRAMFERNLATCPADYLEQYKAQWPLIEKAVKEGK